MSTFDHEVKQEVDSASNLEFSRAFRCSRTNYVRSAPQSLLYPTFSVLKTGLFEHALIDKVIWSNMDWKPGIKSCMMDNGYFRGICKRILS